MRNGKHREGNVRIALQPGLPSPPPAKKTENKEILSEFFSYSLKQVGFYESLSKSV